MIPRIEAGETLAAINRAALTNNLTFENELDRQAAIARLERKARGEREPAPARADPQDLAGMGIGVSEEAAPEIADRAAWLGGVGHG
ncbi:hypothetical protein [Erythrobacter sp. WG]|uniref:hypothetical protein n=1 Tax=Erythrobacter sp. WG TaxID=2985510 RepID=UPI00226F663C|nr:hypothetical protein [Erythrobacter sp. WG]MCX9146622.1 hypothetical protein [Erythrobacter sp. WG]